MDHIYSLLVVEDSKMNKILSLSQRGQGLLEGERKIRNSKLSTYSVIVLQPRCPFANIYLFNVHLVSVPC